MRTQFWVAQFTLTKKGKRCSRIATIFTCPIDPLLTISISLATGGMYLYSSPTWTNISGLFLAASTTYFQNITKVIKYFREEKNKHQHALNNNNKNNPFLTFIPSLQVIIFLLTAWVLVFRGFNTNKFLTKTQESSIAT